MTRPATWHAATIEQLADMCRADADVEALALLGSAAQGRADVWSDLDLLLVVRDGALERFFPPRTWLAPLGPIYASELHPGEFTPVARLCFEDLRRIDLIVTTVSALQRHAEWPSRPFAGGNRVLFSRNPGVDAVLGLDLEIPAPHVSYDAFEDLANGFWFKGIVAVQKVVRGDRLVAFHLSLELIQEVAVLAMLLRDRETGTNQHRGGIGDDEVLALEPTRQPHTPAGILASIAASAVAFDRLAAWWSAEYQPRRGPLLEWVQAAQAALAEDDR
jgi:predicted nucleotidyltransferase